MNATNNKPSEALSRALNEGKIVFIGEWRGVLPETINYTDRKTGAKAKFARLLHTVEVGEGNRIESVKVSQSVPDGTDPASVAIVFKRGQRVLVEVGEMTAEKGNKNIRANSINSLD